VKPWQITLVFLSTRMDMFSLPSHEFAELNKNSS
jgi:hypothetical protein